MFLGAAVLIFPFAGRGLNAVSQTGAAVTWGVRRWRACAFEALVAPSPSIGTPANRAQIIDIDFDATPYLSRLKNASVRTIGRYYDRAYGTGIGEVCYHNKKKTLTKAELTAIENAGMSVYVVFQHCNRSCANFDMAKQANRRQGAQGRDGRRAVGARSRPACSHPDLFRRRFRSYPGRDCPIPAARIWPSVEAYFDQINEVFAQTSWQVGIYGAGVTCSA